MANSLWRLTKSLYNTPHLITPEAFEQIEAYLLNRNSGVELSGGEAFKQYSSNLKLTSKDVGVINILGPLSYRADAFEALCGMTSYQTAVKSFDALLEEGIKTVVLYVDGPGGEAYGAFETGRYFREKADAEGVRLIAYVDGLAASATYALATSAHEVVINPEASAGSIGVVVSLINNSKNLENNGYERMFVYAGDNKIPYAEDGSFREPFLEDIQKRVDELYMNFISYVADMRSISEDVVMDTKAGVFNAETSLSLGLVTSIMSRQEFNSYISTLSHSKTKQSLGEKMDTEIQGISMEDLQKQLADLQEANAKLLADAQSKAVAELETKAVEWSFAGVDASAYATAAFTGSVPVSMFDAAMDAAKEALSNKDKSIAEMKGQLEAMESLGDESETTPEAKVDPIDAALEAEAAKQNIKIKQ